MGGGASKKNTSHKWGASSKADIAEFRRRGHEMIDFIADMYENIEKTPVKPQVKKGYLYKQMDVQAPEKGQSWKQTMQEVQSKVLPGVLHWQHPRFFAYYPGIMGFPALLGDLLADSLNQPGFTWQACPVASELEVVVLEWLIKAMELPGKFSRKKGGGGSIQPTASEACLVAMIAARKKKLDQLGEKAEQLRDKLTFYCAASSHFCFQKAASIMGYNMKSVPTVWDPKLSNAIVDTKALEQILNKDKEDGCIPTFVSATFGTTASASIDPISRIGDISAEYGLWFHVDAAYAGSALFCPEFRSLANGIEKAQSYNFNLSKWFPALFNSSILYVEEPKYQVESLNHTAIFIFDEARQEDSVPDFKDYEISLGRKFKSLKIWFTLQSYGLEGIRSVIRRHITIATTFEERVKQDNRFELACGRLFGLVCLRFRGATNQQTSDFCAEINKRGQFHLGPGEIEGKTMIRVVPCYQYAEESHILSLWKHLNEVADAFFK